MGLRSHMVEPAGVLAAEAGVLTAGAGVLAAGDSIPVVMVPPFSAESVESSVRPLCGDTTGGESPPAQVSRRLLLRRPV